LIFVSYSLSDLKIKKPIEYYRLNATKGRLLTGLAARTTNLLSNKEARCCPQT
jgi:hypothetical protein